MKHAHIVFLVVFFILCCRLEYHYVFNSKYVKEALVKVSRVACLVFFMAGCRLYDAATNSVMARYAVQRILFYARGAAGTAQAACFAFTWSHGDTKESAVFQCHVFK